jgi:hypothetical protein
MYFQVLGVVMFLLGVIVAGIGAFRFSAITKRLKKLHDIVELID